MNIKDAKQEIIHTIMAYTAKNEWGGYEIPALRQRPLLLIGPPGIGKTAVMSQAAAECSVGFVSYTMTHHTRQSAIGLPYIEHRSFGGREYAVTEYTMSEIIASVYRCIEESGCREGLLFLDEINCVSETLAPAMLQFLQTKTFGSHRLPDGWVLAAAGNPSEYNKSVREFDIATLDRLKYIPVEADYDAWRPYALESRIHGAILSYLDTHPEQFYVLKQSYSSKAFATARGWEDLSCLLLEYEALSLPVTAELIRQYLHTEELSRDFSGYYHWYRARGEALPVAAMLKGDDSAAAACRRLLAEGSFEEQLHLVHLMLSCIGNRLQSLREESCQQKAFRDALEQLARFQKQQRLTSLQTAVKPFLEREREVLDIRKKHGLSSEQEIRSMQQTLYTLQDAAYRFYAADGLSDPEDMLQFFKKEARAKELSLAQAASSILLMIENGISLFSEKESAAFTVFLSSLRQNPLAQNFLNQHPSEACERCFARLDFTSREEALRKSLLEQ
ncbi:MAG: AAA family ATPase [Lachnospiraceae bacterium]|nr:AAA family ATPase [Lachnospiraceae bacterium]